MLTIILSCNNSHEYMVQNLADFKIIGISIESTNEGGQSIDDMGNLWELQEDALQLKGESLAYPVFPAHNAFWFGFKAAFPDTRLIK